jgi:hypothetical protein
MRQQGFSVLGVEPSIHTARKANDNGIPTVCAFFNHDMAKEIKSKHGSADIITSNNVFANINNLTEFMVGIDNLLSEKGWFIIETGYGLDLINNIVIDNIHHEHLSYFLCSSLQSFLEKAGFQIVRVDRVATKGGSIRIFCQRLRSDVVPEWSAIALIQMEKELGFDSFTPYVRFRQTVDALRLNILDSVSTLRKRGSVAAFGASVGGTALLYWLSLTEKEIYCLYDDNSVKHGLYCPGLGLEVRSASIISQDMPSSVLNLAWRYLSPITKRHYEYFKNGGLMLQILPCIQLLRENNNIGV